MIRLFPAIPSLGGELNNEGTWTVGYYNVGNLERKEQSSVWKASDTTSNDFGWLHSSTDFISHTHSHSRKHMMGRQGVHGFMGGYMLFHLYKEKLAWVKCFHFLFTLYTKDITINKILLSLISKKKKKKIPSNLRHSLSCSVNGILTSWFMATNFLRERLASSFVRCHLTFVGRFYILCNR